MTQEPIHGQMVASCNRLQLQAGRILSNIKESRVPTMVQWVKNLTAAACVPEEVCFCYLSQHRGLKDPAFPQLQCRTVMWLRFNPWPRNFHMPWCSHKIKNIYILSPPNLLIKSLKEHYKIMMTELCLILIQ